MIENDNFAFDSAYHLKALKNYWDLPFPTYPEWNVSFLIEPPKDWVPKYPAQCIPRVPPFHSGSLDYLHPSELIQRDLERLENGGSGNS